jgi:hypothetical protein
MGRKLGDKRLVKDDVWHPFVATPAYDGKVDVDYSQSLAESCFLSPLHMMKVTASVMGNGAFIDLARNLFVKIFLEQEKDCTHLFFIDSDLKFPANAFIGLARSGHPICAGVYRRRQEKEDYPIIYAEHKDGGLWVEDDWVMAERVPTGFLCIRRDVVEEMAADAVQMTIHGQEGTVPQLFYTKTDKENRFVGEDFCFCDDYLKRYKQPIPVWPNIDFVHGGYECNLSDYLERQIEENAA